MKKNNTFLGKEEQPTALVSLNERNDTGEQSEVEVETEMPKPRKIFTYRCKIPDGKNGTAITERETDIDKPSNDVDQKNKKFIVKIKEKIKYPRLKVPTI